MLSDLEQYITKMKTSNSSPCYIATDVMEKIICVVKAARLVSIEMKLRPFNPDTKVFESLYKAFKKLDGEENE